MTKHSHASSARPLAGKVVAITGAGRGIGAATAKVLHAAGAKVAIGDIDLASAEDSAAAIGPDVLAFKLDVTDTADFDAFLDRVEAAHGPLDVLVNNAGIMPLARAQDTSDELTRRVFDINVLAMIHGTREAVRRMLPRGRGHVVVLASTAGKAGIPGATTYCASKFAMVGFCEALDAELADTSIEVSCVMPGIVRTELATGVPDLPGFKSVSPEQVAEGIRDALIKPRLAVFVPRSAGPLIASTRLIPHRAQARIGKAMHTDKVFLDAIDGSERDAYEARARGK